MTKSKFGKGGKSIHRGAQATHGRRRDSPQDTLEISHNETNDIPRSRSTIDKNQYQSHERVEEERGFMSHDARETNDIVHRSGSQTNNENSQSHIKDARSEIKVYKGKVRIFSDGARKTSKKFTEKIDVGGFTWSKVSQPTKDFYFYEFKEVRDGRPPTAHELFLHTHTKKQDRKTFVDGKSKKINDNVIQLTKRHKANHESVEGDQSHKSMDNDDIFFEAAGGKKKGRVYGLGCQSSTYFPSPIEKIAATQTLETESRYKKAILVMSKELKAVKKQLRAERTLWESKFNGLCGHLGFSTESVQIKGKQSVELENYTSDSSDDDDEIRSQEGSMDYGDEEDNESDSGSMDSGNEDCSESNG
ncbi:OLC1v1008937C1 [Oldenlandia corymbosa var. corymbosa]|uniref:OLC1v1008937C1 n=1 Tax=Oldenlandia corymbosa var. corymbosa TaxID=529605 RepID=A0AAV1DR18_OLDCO|nr:OLC1v1008937C1 [Oldenlandia corymbosa var. corymbosa]